MTPSEKKAKELVAEMYDGDFYNRYPFQEDGLELITSFLREAERRGFERAKRMACKKAKDFREDLENLKYEEEAK